MDTHAANRSSSWKHPDELLKIQRLKQKKKQLAARLSQNNNNLHCLDIKDVDKESLLEAKIAQKRKNPFAKQSTNEESTKKLRTDAKAAHLEQEDALYNLINDSITSFVRETPTRPAPAKLVLQPFDPKEFAKLLHQNTPTSQNENDGVLEELKFSKHLPMDWCLKTRVRFFSRSELPATTLKTNQMASGLTSFVRCIDNLNTDSGLDISPATRFNQATYYWQHPHLPWLKLFPRNSRENTGITIGELERQALAEDWDYSFRGLFQLLRARQCPYFYLCANGFTVLFRAAGTGGRVEMHAFMTPSTRGMRSTLRQEGIEFSMPLKRNDGNLNKSGEGSNNSEDRNVANAVSATKEKAGEGHENDDKDGDDDDSDDEEEEKWLEKLGVDEKEIRRIKATHSRKVQAEETADDFSESSLLFIEGVECQGFFSFLLNAKSTITNVGRLAGVPPTLLAPVAFPKATMQHLTTRSNKVRMDGQDYFSVEVKGIVMPTFLPYVCNLLGETKDKFSATLASSNTTLAFTKATQQLIEKSAEEENSLKPPSQDDVAAEQVFDQENLSDCGLLPCVVESICRMGPSAVALLERVCYDKDHGFAWS